MEERLLRLTWNQNRWELPSGHPWRKDKQGDRNTAFENQYGFGGEEWLFNPRYNIDGYQYGYIRGLFEVATNFIDRAYLFTIEPKSKDRILVGILKNVELFDEHTFPSKASEVYKRHWQDMEDELGNVNADSAGFDAIDIEPFLRFKLEEAEIYNGNVLVNELKDGARYNRFKPYLIDEHLKGILLGKANESKKFLFKPGRRKNEGIGYIKTILSRSTFVKSLHVQIIKDIAVFINQNLSTKADDISFEKTAFGNNIADVVLRNQDNSLDLIEIKTSYNTRYNIREAIGQLLDYALWHEDIVINKLVIVAPTSLDKEHLSYLKRLKNKLKIPLEYWTYNKSAKVKFEIVQT